MGWGLLDGALAYDFEKKFQWIGAERGGFGSKCVF
jgi:hypothetical protein